jgi:mannose-6-phosphate isomerase
MSLLAPLRFTPVYKTVLWGGRRLARWRPELPPGAIGEAWDLADHSGGMSVVAGGPLAGETLHALAVRFGAELVGRGFSGGVFPLMVKLIDATDRLSVQVHPDDDLARSLGVGVNGKTECWLVLEDGGELYQGTRPGVDRAAFEAAIASGTVPGTLNRFEPRAGDCFFLAARTVHALGAGCLVYELQQTLDVTFRVHDWDRLGADGQPRPLHREQALATIDFGGGGFGPRRPAWVGQDPRRRTLADCPYFHLEELRSTGTVALPATGACSVITCLEGEATVRTAGGTAVVGVSQTVLIPAAAGAVMIEGAAHLALASPRL